MAQANAARIGAFVLGGAGLLVGVVLGFGSGTFFQPSVERSIIVAESVQGLQTGAPVTYNGVVVGEVAEIGARLDVEEAQIVNGVRLRLHGAALHADRDDLDVGEVVDLLTDRGLRAQLALQSVVTAALYVRLVMAPEVEPYPAPDTFLGAPTMPAIPSDMARFGQVAETVGADLPRALARLTDVADAIALTLNEENRASIAAMLASFAGFAAALDAIGPDLAAAAADVRAATGVLPGLAQRGERLLDDLDAAVEDNRDRIEAVAQSVADAAANAAGAAAQLDAMVRENRRGLRSFTEEGLPEFRALAIQAQAMARAVERVARRIETEGAGGLIGGETLREYQPRSR
ncbi:MAG: MCE family protein [Rhodobacteraceae bacterium]|nr:MAG: MCE family protein [Paracoccaceae bacterium]